MVTNIDGLFRELWHIFNGLPYNSHKQRYQVSLIITDLTKLWSKYLHLMATDDDNRLKKVSGELKRMFTKFSATYWGNFQNIMTNDTDYERINYHIHHINQCVNRMYCLINKRPPFRQVPPPHPKTTLPAGAQAANVALDGAPIQAQAFPFQAPAGSSTQGPTR
ncbi:uncharacterized protein LOC128957170 [Oppia nitens]|uniref:uncharacterized protein LOC128957170 n=1 Tax=Oppia nitens TaxID=1686743 RepID=UPI0023DCBDEB|nr:uncharacterized protein LOC128957170 [Oppia nitens]